MAHATAKRAGWQGGRERLQDPEISLNLWMGPFLTLASGEIHNIHDQPPAHDACLSNGKESTLVNTRWVNVNKQRKWRMMMYRDREKRLSIRTHVTSPCQEVRQGEPNPLIRLLHATGPSAQALRENIPPSFHILLTDLHE